VIGAREIAKSAAMVCGMLYAGLHLGLENYNHLARVVKKEFDDTICDAFRAGVTVAASDYVNRGGYR